MNEDIDFHASLLLGTPILPRPPASHGNQHSHHDQRPPPQLQHRSCAECCRRKVRCDRYHPCANCVKGRSECIFPKSRRAPNRQKKTTRSRDEELLKSLRRLERRLQSNSIPERPQSPSNDDKHLEKPDKPGEGTTESNGVIDKREEPARLVLDQDRSRYISNNFWASMSREVSFRTSSRIVSNQKH